MIISRVRLAIALCAAFLGCPGAAQATQYPLKCQGASAFQYRAPIEGDTSSQYAILYFNKSASGYGHSPLLPGTCAWEDRGLKSSEPGCVAFATEGLELTSKLAVGAVYPKLSIAPRSATERAFNDAIEGGSATFYVEGPLVHVNSPAVEPGGNCFQAVLK